ncbi:MAG: hypothetical protein ABI847_00145, partial [Anaerolineales bacterium]
MPNHAKHRSTGFSRWLRLAASIGLGSALLAALFGLLVQPAQAATCTVPGTYGTIQAAITDVACDIIMVDGAAYFEHLSIGREVEIYGTGATIVDGSLTGRVVNITTNVRVIISGTILQRGLVGGNGGGLINQGQLTLINSQVLSSSANSGGAFALAYKDVLDA